ncbi:hypothetical protein BDV93DRAFT_514768 [Ceratobasidium sp. AG-I]|nr:hypothetical protein BDV93DRAFT_514768 [Ceratobasidium sp. AG-I]
MEEAWEQVPQTAGLMSRNHCDLRDKTKGGLSRTLPAPAHSQGVDNPEPPLDPAVLDWLDLVDYLLTIFGKSPIWQVPVGSVWSSINHRHKSLDPCPEAWHTISQESPLTPKLSPTPLNYSRPVHPINHPGVFSSI